MRIIAGTYKNRTITSPHTTKTHPMSEQVRGAIFNTLGDIEGLIVLDAFAGSGAVGLEAISRGAKQVFFIESDAAAGRIITENIRNLHVHRQTKAIKTTVHNWLETSDQTFDIIIADPPYHDTQPGSVARLAKRLNNEGWLVVSWPGKTDLPTIAGCALALVRNYGDAQVGYYQFSLV